MDIKISQVRKKTCMKNFESFTNFPDIILAVLNELQR